MHRYQRPGTSVERLATSLGYFSIGLGLAELLAPGAMARLIGIDDGSQQRRTLRAFGARELANGAAILGAPQDANWLWSRAAGDALDLAFLGWAGRQDGANGRRVAAAAAAVAGVAALDLYSARQLQQRRALSRRETRSGVLVEETTTVNRPVEQVYAFWRRLENLPGFMRHLESVEQVDDRHSRWRAKGPAGTSVSWDAEIVEEREHEALSWRSLEGSRVRNRGTVAFGHAPGARGTELRVTMEYAPPAGSIGRGLAWLFGEEPSQQIHEDLHRFKQLLETGEISRSDGPSLRRPARPRGTVAGKPRLAEVRR